MPPSSLTASRGLPESSSSVSTSGAAARASSTDSGPVTWITCTSRVSGSEPAQAPQLRLRDVIDELDGGRAAAALLAAIASASTSAVSRKVSVGARHAGRDARDLRLPRSGPGRSASPRRARCAEAPAAIASRASSRSAMQQTFTNSTAHRSLPACSRSARSRGSAAARRRSAGPSALP